MISLSKIISELEINKPINITVKDVLKQISLSVNINLLQTTTVLVEYGYVPASRNMWEWLNSFNKSGLKQLYNDLQNISN